jgi:hypothetical protein
MLITVINIVIDVIFLWFCWIMFIGIMGLICQIPNIICEITRTKIKYDSRGSEDIVLLTDV